MTEVAIMFGTGITRNLLHTFMRRWTVGAIMKFIISSSGGEPVHAPSRSSGSVFGGKRTSAGMERGRRNGISPPHAPRLSGTEAACASPDEAGMGARDA